MSAASVVTELAKIDALPCAKVEPSVGDGNVDAHTGNDALGMCGHIVRAFEDVKVVQHIFRYKPVVNRYKTITSFGSDKFHSNCSSVMSLLISLSGILPIPSGALSA